VRQLVPPLVLENYAAGNFQGEFPAVGLFVDISGFSSTTDTLMQHGQHGAEVLARIMRHVFEPLGRSIYEQGGFIAGFGGDALLAVFRAASDQLGCAQRGLAAAWSIQRYMAEQPEYVTEYGVFPISVKIGLSGGNLCWRILHSQGKRRATYYFHGEAVTGSARAEKQAHPGEIILSADISDWLANQITVVPVGDYFRLVGLTSALPNPRPVPAPQVSAAAQSPFRPDTLLERDLRSEFRQAITVHIAFPDLSPDELETFVNRVFELQAGYGGIFPRIDLSDKGWTLMLSWGAPVAYENDIERALNFILTLQAVAGFEFRAGVTYHVSWAGFMGCDLMEEYTCYGWGVNLAARLMSAAPSGEIWLDERVAERVGHLFELSFMGEQSLKGFARPQKAYQLGGRKEVTEAIFQGEMFGREVELKALEEFVAPLWQGHYAGTLTVWGDPGMGKSRLLHEFQKSSLFEQHPSTWALCQCDQLLRASFNPFRYWLRAYFGISNSQTADRKRTGFDQQFARLVSVTSDEALKVELEHARSFLAALVDVYWPDSLYDQMDAQGRYDNTFLALTSLVKAESRHQPLILVIEDAQYLDDDSTAFLVSLTRSLSVDADLYPVALLATSRRQGEALPLSEVLLERQIDLAVLDASSLANLAEGILGGIPDPDLLQLLKKRAEGNPFFAEQILRYLQQSGSLQFDGDMWSMTQAGDEAALPVDITSILVARLDQLTGTVRETVQTAAVLGREFEVRVLAHMLRDDTRLSDEIAEAEHSAIWVALNEIRYLFRHALLRDAAYTMQMQARRQELHALAVESLEAVYAESLEQYYDELAYHAEQAHLRKKAIRYLQLAGDAARDAYQNNQTIDYYTRALALISADDFEIRYSVLLEREKTYALTGMHEKQARDLDALKKLASQHGDTSRQVDVGIRWTNYLVNKGKYEQAVRNAGSILDIAKGIDNPELSARAALSAMFALHRQGDSLSAIKVGEIGLTQAKKVKNYQLEGQLLNNLGLAALGQNNFDAAATFFEQSLLLFRKINNLRQQAMPLNNLGMIAGYRVNYATAQMYYEQALEINREVGNRNEESLVLINLGWVAGLMGNYGKACSYIEQAIRIARETGNRLNETYALINLSSYARMLGDTSTALSSAENGYKLAADSHDRNAEAWALTYLGHVLFALKRNSESEVAYQTALAIRQELSQSVLATEPRSGLALIALENKNMKSAHDYVSQTLAFLDGGGTLIGTDEPLRVYFSCYQILHAYKNQRAISILEIAHDMLLERLENIKDEDLRKSFLLNIPYHQEILSAWQSTRGNV
jgi:class 3 adenylate cyclase/tetratricopeptide (TPR) repeat protein